MPLHVAGIRLSVDDERRLKNSAAVAQRIENKWDLRVRREIRDAARRAADQVTAGSDPTVPDFERLLIEHYFESTIAGFRVAESDSEERARLAKAPKSLRDIMRLYDQWRRGLWKPKRVARYAERLKEMYLDKVYSSWRKYSADFRDGGEETQVDIQRRIQRAAETTTARAQTIVRTETTRHYNQARRSYYDESKDVTHYLFMAVRDKATTPWCTPKTVNGKRGRHGLVYAKGDPLLDKETPPCHWNCRSELLPLLPFNPSHRKLINSPSLARRNHTCTPLPKEWRS